MQLLWRQDDNNEFHEEIPREQCPHLTNCCVRRYQVSMWVIINLLRACRACHSSADNKDYPIAIFQFDPFMIREIPWSPRMVKLLYGLLVSVSWKFRNHSTQVKYIQEMEWNNK